MANLTMRFKDAAVVLDGDVGLHRGAYPFFDESYRETLNGKIMDRYQNREIAYESVEMFRLALRRRMNEIMPKYNLLYQSELLKFDPFVTVEMLTDTEQETTANASAQGQSDGTTNVSAQGTSEATGSTTTSGDSETASNSDAESRALNLDYPQSELNSEGMYATSGAESKSGNSGTGTTTENTQADTTNTGSDTQASEQIASATDSQSSEQSGTGKGKTESKGFQGSRAALLMEYRSTFLNIDMDILHDIRDCFMMAWDTGATYTEQDNGFLGGMLPWRY